MLGPEQEPQLYFPSLRELYRMGVQWMGYDMVKFEVGSPIFDRLIAVMEKTNKYYCLYRTQR